MLAGQGFSPCTLSFCGASNMCNLFHTYSKLHVAIFCSINHLAKKLFYLLTSLSLPVLLTYVMRFLFQKNTGWI